jgi:hypothetical protein
MESIKQNRLKRLLQSIVDGIVQDVPPELDVCEMCRKPRCSQDEWIVCENRILHMKCLEAYEKKTSLPGGVISRLNKRAEMRGCRATESRGEVARIAKMAAGRPLFWPIPLKN